MANFIINQTSQTAIGTADADTFTFLGFFNNNVSGAGGNDTFQGLISFGMAYGDAGDDAFNFGTSLSSSLFGGDGNDSLFALISTGSVLNGLTGNDWLGIGGAGNVLNGGDGVDWLGATGIFNNLNGGDGADTLVAAGNNNVLAGAEGADTLVSTGNNSTLLGQAGDDSLQIMGVENFLLGGDGNDSLFASQAAAGQSDNKLSGDAGNDWVGSSGDFVQVIGGSGDDWVGATGNGNILNGGTGNDTLSIGGISTNTKALFQVGSGQDTVLGFIPPDSNLISIEGFVGVTNFAQLQPLIQQSGNNTVITLNSNDILTLSNVQATSLTAADFVFA